MRNWLRIPLTLKYFLGIALVQGVTILLVYAWWRTGSTDVILTFAGLGLVAALFAALWFASVGRGHDKEALIRAEGHLARERERHRRLTEKERVKAAEHARKQVQRESSRVKTRSNIKLYTAMAGIAGLGTLLLLTSFLSLGVLLVSSSGGAVAGYWLRARQDLRRRSLPPVQEGAQWIPGPQPHEATRLRTPPQGAVERGALGLHDREPSG